MRVRLLARETSDKRTGVFTSSTVAIESDRKVALCVAGSQHAAENMADVLNRRAGNLSPHPLKCAMRLYLPRRSRIVTHLCSFKVTHRKCGLLVRKSMA